MKRKYVFITLLLIAITAGFLITGCASYSFGTSAEARWKATFINESYHTIRVTSNFGDFTMEPRSFKKFDIAPGTWVEFNAYDLDTGERLDNMYGSEVQIWLDSSDGNIFYEKGPDGRDPLPELEE
jgi:hypothetical protein